MEFYDITADQENNQQKAIESTKFTIVQDSNISKGIFYAFRWVWFLTVNGRRWQIISTTMILTLLGLPITLAVDIILMLLYVLWNGSKAIIKKLWDLLVKLIEKFFTKLIYPTVAFLLKIMIVISLTIILIYKFNYIKNLVFNLFEYFT